MLHADEVFYIWRKSNIWVNNDWQLTKTDEKYIKHLTLEYSGKINTNKTKPDYIMVKLQNIEEKMKSSR